MEIVHYFAQIEKCTDEIIYVQFVMKMSKWFWQKLEMALTKEI